jgi:aryl-alcohol dehydrogenase-like predicted oxidoreductase
MVIATKYTTNFQAGPKGKNVMANFTGTGSKSLHVSVEASLKKLQTDYIDLVSKHLLVGQKTRVEKRKTD